MASTMTSSPWIVFVGAILLCVSSQELGLDTNENKGICKSLSCQKLESLSRLDDCVVVVGNLHIVLMERTTIEDFANKSYPLREVTGYLLFYRVKGLESIGQIFPNLTRIRGQQLFGNYALIVYDVLNLKEVGLRNFMQVDRGGVIVWGCPLSCTVDTVIKKYVRPKSRHIINPKTGQERCYSNNSPHSTSCWVNKYCEFGMTVHTKKCSKECFGCNKHNPNKCSLCRYYTYRGTCVRSCPPGTIVFRANNYCITKVDCYLLKGELYNDTCVLECPFGCSSPEYNSQNIITLQKCSKCSTSCRDLHITTIEAAQAAKDCVFVNGSLTINIRAVAEAMSELNTHLSQIKEVRDYVWIYGSNTISSLDFLSSLQIIRGQKLQSQRYSLVIENMKNLTSLFKAQVTKDLKIVKGNLKVLHNPLLCLSKIEELKEHFATPSEYDIPEGLNGYSGGCTDDYIGLQVKMVNQTTALVMMSPSVDPTTKFDLLYTLVPWEYNIVAPNAVVPESCSHLNWYLVSLHPKLGQTLVVRINSLLPGYRYALCIESYDPVRRYLARTSMQFIETPIDAPAPPFITKLAAESDTMVVLRWADHERSRKQITHHVLEVKIVEIEPKHALIRNHCNKFEEVKPGNPCHAVQWKPPPGYGSSCEYCNADTFNTHEIFEDRQVTLDPALKLYSLTSDGFIQSLRLVLRATKNIYHIGNLHPYRDYRFQLRACVNSSCSDVSQDVVKTLPSKHGDLARVINVTASTDGIISMIWERPRIVNGVILSYLVEVDVDNVNFTITDVEQKQWCVLSNIHQLKLKAKKSKTYLVRICTTSLGSTRTCIDWIRVNAQRYDQVLGTPWYSIALTGLFFGVLLWTLSVVTVWYIGSRSTPVEFRPLIDFTERYRVYEDYDDFNMYD